MAELEMQRRAHLYVGNLSPRVTEYMLTEIFAVAGPVQHVKIIPDRNYQHAVSITASSSILTCVLPDRLQTLNGRKIFDTEIRVNWAYQGQQNKEDTTATTMSLLATSVPKSTTTSSPKLSVLWYQCRTPVSCGT